MLQVISTVSVYVTLCQILLCLNFSSFTLFIKCLITIYSNGDFIYNSDVRATEEMH